MNEWQRKCRTVERTGEFRQAVLDISEEWKRREMHRKGQKGWKVGVVDFWDALVKDAGGIGEELEPYHLCVRAVFSDDVYLTKA
jgi:hypothetical protein